MLPAQEQSRYRLQEPSGAKRAENTTTPAVSTTHLAAIRDNKDKTFGPAGLLYSFDRERVALQAGGHGDVLASLGHNLLLVGDLVNLSIRRSAPPVNHP